MKMANSTTLLFIVLAIYFQIFVSFSSKPDHCLLDPWQGGKMGNPGAKLRVNQFGLDYAQLLASQNFSTVLANLKAPAVRIGDLTIYGMRVSEFQLPKYYRKLVQPNMVRWGFDQGQIAVTSGFSQVIRKPPFIHSVKSFVNRRQDAIENITAILTVASGSTSLDTTSTMSKDVDGRPNVLSMTCTAKLGLLNVTLSGNNPGTAISNSIQNLIVRQIQTVFEALICTSARSLIMTAVNERLKTYPAKVKIDSNLILDYGLTENPRVLVANDAIEGVLKSVVYSRNPPVYPFYPPTIVEGEKSDNSTMLDFFMTSYTLNTLFFVAHQQKMLNFVVTPSSVSSSVAQLLRLSCPTSTVTRRGTEDSNCVGRIFSNSTFGSKAYVVVSMNTTGPPKAAFNFSEAYWIAKGKVDMHVVDNSKKTLLFSANASCVCSSLIPRVYKNTLYATTNNTYLQLNIIDSPLKALSKQNVAKLGSIVAVILEELINGFLSVGFPLPLIDGVSLSSPNIQMTPGTLHVSGNFTYSGQNSNPAALL